ncbi:MAG: hypothetical protein WBI34_05125, partial [Tenuifilaceae bacterium]
MKKVIYILIILILLAGTVFIILRPRLAVKNYNEGIALSDSSLYEQAVEKFTRAIRFNKKVDKFYHARA